jgi:hypothetical protein
MTLLLHNFGQFVLGGVAVLGLNRVIFTAPLMDAVAPLIVGVAFIGLLFIRPTLLDCASANKKDG